MVGLIITLSISAIISIVWVIGIDNHMKHKKKNPDHQDDGWLDWDKKQDQ